MTKTLVNPFADTEVLTGSCRGGTCVLNTGHDATHRTHYLAGDRVLQLAGAQLRKVDGSFRIYSKLRTPCCGSPSFEAVDTLVWRQERGFDHSRRCGYRVDGTGKKNGTKGCGWHWTVEPVFEAFVPDFLSGSSTAVVWVCGEY